MSRRSNRTRQVAFNRANTVPIVMPGGATMYVPAGQLQSTLGQVFYGNKAHFPTNQDPVFSPGTPLAPQPNVDPKGIPVRYPFPVAYNTFPVDRTQGNPDIPGFQQLRMLAKMYSGITLCERTWFDMVPRMTVQIKLKPEYVAQGLEEKDFQEDISYFRRWFERPDGKHTADDGSAVGGKDTHTWLRKALREQTQIDELYLYKNRTRGGQLLGLKIIAGDSMKPLLDIWGDTPAPDDPQPYAFQQYPWGLPGMQYTTDMMLHYQESPAADTPYGQSRVERIIMEVNQALRKKKRDLAMFTEGNIPKAIGEVPDSTNWTPDQIDAYQQQWNSLMAGNPAMQVGMRFTMPGMKIIQLDNGQIMTEFDQWLINISVGCYGMSMGDLGFTDDIHKSSGDSQQNMLYRRTVGPIAFTYQLMLTDVMNHDFEPALHGEMFDLTFGGFEEQEDEQSKAETLTMYTNAGILGLTNAAKLAKLPEDPNAPHIGRVYMSKDGPVFLDDMASDTMRKAAATAKMAGFELAANPPDPTVPAVGKNDTEEEDDETIPPTQPKTTPKSGNGTTKSVGNGTAKAASTGKASNARGTGKAQNRTVGTDLDSTSDDAQTGMMLAFLLDGKTAKKLAIPDGEPVEDLHITLAYLGDMEDEPTDDLLRPHTSPFKIKDTIAAIASEAKPLSGTVGGIGRFFPAETDETPVIALVDVPGLAEFRTKLVQAIEAVGYFIADNHGYTPHITLAYVNADAPMPVEDVPSVSLTLDTVWLCVGDKRTPFKIGDNHEENTQGQDKTNSGTASQGGATTPTTLARAHPGSVELGMVSAEYRRWRQRAIDDIKAVRDLRGFTSVIIPESTHQRITDELADCSTVEEVRAVFERARGHSVSSGDCADVAAHVKALFESVERRGSTALAERK